MDFWLKNSMRNIFLLSEEKKDFKAAIKEWAFTGEIVDHEAPIETCKLCEHEAVRYHYEIENKLQNSLWVGSSCIEKFDITIYDSDGNEVTKNKEAYLIEQAKKKHVNGVFDKLIHTKPIGKISRNGVEFRKIELDEGCKNDFVKDGKVNARILNYLFMRCDEENIFYEKRFFSLSLHSQENKDKLISLNLVQFERIKAALSTSQMKFYYKNKRGSKS